LKGTARPPLHTLYYILGKWSAWSLTVAKGKERKRYRYEKMMTPYEKFKSLPEASQYLKPSLTFEKLANRRIYTLCSDSYSD
jgi:hypothetical protein